MQNLILEEVTFKSLTETDDPISEEKIIAWLESANEIEFDVGNDYFDTSNPEYSLVIDEPLSARSLQIFNLDPGSATILIAGLSAILAWISTERRHRETLANSPPGNTTNDKIEKSENCKKIEAEKICNLPLSNTMRVKGNDFLILFRACTKKPLPHTTIEYYKI